MRYSLQSSDIPAADTVPLFGPALGCDLFEQRLLRYSDASEESGDSENDEVLYVISGTGSISLGDDRTEVGAGNAAYIGRDTPWRVEEANDLVLLSVLVRNPLPGNGRTHAVLRPADAENATAGRQFQLLATPAIGCATVTQFIGIIPVVRAPDHFHTYDEVVYVLDGVGALHIDGESSELRAGSCIYLPARVVHCLENVGPGEMHVLGVFRPAGSPAEAYYPDGTAAQY